ncbi:uncharacterized protein si:ch211-214p13.7 isoform X2 [Puntigrus tetrazona]|uniref:uncharacterized protein si:ch211-214p13.7 isoform X2 n=1 Tax=Puntigrus tetrazona TaxID=1606681 RepID=UPI001C89B5B8|nr:uncharacterized protein si:ch211-214p13.7 isoform X2 [Puntigrus tetrazona]
MGSFLSCNRRKKKPENTDNDNQAETETEDVLYASIDHGNVDPNRPVRENAEDNDCDYAVVMLPQNAANTAKHKGAVEDSSDDYVLMG